MHSAGIQLAAAVARESDQPGGGAVLARLGRAEMAANQEAMFGV